MLTYDLSKKTARTRTLALYESIKNDIITGVLKPGEKLPSKRELAEHLSVSVITVENACVILEEEGYITARPRVGFFVNDLMLPARSTAPGQSISDRENDPQNRSLSARSPLDEADLLPEEASERPSSKEAAAYFPTMARITRRLLSERPEILQQRSPQYGCAVLRNAIAEYLRRYRSMPVRPVNIIIGSGAEYLYSRIVQLFGNKILYGIESPSYKKIELVLRANGAAVDYLQMGSDGILTEELDRTEAGLLHVTPYHSFPTGVTASAEKRYEYLAWAYRRKAVIVEDDYDSEFAFFRKPIDTLYAMDTTGCVVYMNTFTKSLSPAIRIAYMVLPDNLLETYDIRLGFYSCPVPVLDQYILAAFISEGGFERHLNRIRREINRSEALLASEEAAHKKHLSEPVRLDDYV